MVALQMFLSWNFLTISSCSTCIPTVLGLIYRLTTFLLRLRYFYPSVHHIIVGLMSGEGISRARIFYRLTFFWVFERQIVITLKGPRKIRFFLSPSPEFFVMALQPCCIFSGLFQSGFRECHQLLSRWNFTIVIGRYGLIPIVPDYDRHLPPPLSPMSKLIFRLFQVVLGVVFQLRLFT